MDTEAKQPAPAGADHLELRAADIAKRKGHGRVTDEDRKQAYEELRQTSPTDAQQEAAAH
jgi:hypothetical protein